MTPDALNERLPDDLTLRPVTGGDRAFLVSVYASTREDELAQTDWPPEVRHAFVLQQFEAQDRYYRESTYPDADYRVIRFRDEDAGRLYVDRSVGEARIIDIAILPAFRGNGIGTSILRALQDECRTVGRSLTIHVERMNRALGLYERLGFRLVEDKGVYLFMRWSPDSDQLNTAS